MIAVEEMPEWEPDRALFGGAVAALVSMIYRNERPLRGLAGLLDWRFYGRLSQCLRSGVITGERGECAYFPISRHGQVYHLLLFGGGDSEAPGKRAPLSSQMLVPLARNLAALKLENVGLSRIDFGGSSPSQIAAQMKGALAAPPGAGKGSSRELKLWIVG